MTDSIPYVGGAYTIPIDVTNVTTPIGNFSALTLTLTSLTNPATTIEFTKAGGGLLVTGALLDLITTDTDITIPDTYALTLKGTLNGQNVPLGLTTGKTLTFYEHV